MSKGFNIVVTGATGVVGVELIKVLEKRNFPVNNLRLFASNKSVGQKIKFKGENLAVEELTHGSFKGTDIAFFNTWAQQSKEFAPSAVKDGAVVIDNSIAFRMEHDVPLIVPEVNPEDIKKHNGIIANPNCSTIIMLVAVFPLHKQKKLKRIIASTYQAASGAGAQAMAELEEQSKQVLGGEKAVSKNFPYQIAFNLFPHIDTFLENDYTKEEMKMLHESRKMMSYPELQVACTCVRVPVFRVHSESLLMEFESEVTPIEVRKILSISPGVEVVDNTKENVYPMPISASGKDNVLVGRIRQDISRPDNKGISMFISGDQLLKGAALNAVQIAELLKN